MIKKLAGNFLGLDDTAGAAVESLAKKVGVSTGVITGALKGVTAGLALAAVGFIGLTTAFNIAKGAAQFEQGLAAVGAVSRASAEELQLLERSALQAGIATQFSPEQAVEGLQSLAAAGQSAQQATESLIPVLDLAAGSLGQLGVAGAAEAVVGTLNAYGKSAEEAASVTDRLLRITQLSNFQTRDFASGLAKAAASAATFNQTLDDTLISMGLLRNRNIDASSASTALREATRRLGSDQRAQLQVTGLGVDVFDKQTKRMRSVLDIMTEFAKATKNLGDEERNRLVVQAFGARGLLAFQAVANATFSTMRDGVRVTLQGAEAIEALRMEMENAEGTAAKFREALADTFKGQLTLLEGSVKTFAIFIGKPFAQILKPVVLFLVDALNLVIKAVSALPESVKKGLAGFFVAGSIAAIITGIGVAIVVLIPLLKAVGAVIFAALGVVLIPALKIIAVIALLVAAGFALKAAWESNFGGIRDAVLPVFEKISLAVRSLIGLFKDGELSGAIAEDLLKAENRGVLVFVATISRVFAVIQAVMRGVSRGIRRIFSRLSTILGPSVSKIGTSLSKLGSIFVRLLSVAARLFGFEQTEGGIKNIEELAEVIIVKLVEPAVFGIELIALAFELWLDSMQPVLEFILQLSSALDNLPQTSQFAFMALASTFATIFDNVIQGIVQQINMLISSINQVSGKVGISPIASISAPRIAPAVTVAAGGVGLAAARSLGATSPTGGAGAAPSVGGGTGAAPPISQPPSSEGRALSNQDFALFIAAIERSRGDTTVTVHSTLEVEGAAIGEAVKEAENESASRKGRLTPGIGR